MSRKMLAPMTASPLTTPRNLSTEAPSPLGTIVARKEPSSVFEHQPIADSCVVAVARQLSAKYLQLAGRATRNRDPASSHICAPVRAQLTCYARAEVRTSRALVSSRTRRALDGHLPGRAPSTVPNG